MAPLGAGLSTRSTRAASTTSPIDMGLRKFREGLQIVGILFVVGILVFGALFVATKTTDPGAEPAMRVEMWCTGYAAGFSGAMMRAGFQPPYSKEWEALVQACIDGVVYLEPYPVQPGVSPPNPSEVLWADKAPPEEAPCLPTLLRQC